jgi:hypothetical protein
VGHRQAAQAYSLEPVPDTGVPDIGVPDIGVPDIGVPDIVAVVQADRLARAVADIAAQAAASTPADRAADSLAAGRLVEVRAVVVAHTLCGAHYMAWLTAKAAPFVVALGHRGRVFALARKRALSLVAMAQAARPNPTAGSLDSAVAQLGGQASFDIGVGLVVGADTETETGPGPGAGLDTKAHDIRWIRPASVASTSSAQIVGDHRAVANLKSGRALWRDRARRKMYTSPCPHFGSGHKSAPHCRRSTTHTSGLPRTP